MISSWFDAALELYLKGNYQMTNVAVDLINNDFLSQKIPLSSSSKNSSALKIFIRKPKILLIEDAPIVQRVHMKFLELLECSVDLAADGASALKIYSDQYDLVFMDIGLPDMDGFAVTRKIRNEFNAKTIPIIALTAFGELMMDEAIAAGMNDLLVKPSPPEELEVVLKKWLWHLLKNL